MSALDEIVAQPFRRDPRELSAGDLAIARQAWQRTPAQCWCCDRWIYRRIARIVGGAYPRLLCAVCYRLAVGS